jgi:hypothetical protein
MRGMNKQSKYAGFFDMGASSQFIFREKTSFHRIINFDYTGKVYSKI